MPGNEYKIGDLVVPKSPTTNLRTDTIYKVVQFIAGKWPVIININDLTKQYIVLPDNLQKADEFKETIYNSTDS